MNALKKEKLKVSQFQNVFFGVLNFPNKPTKKLTNVYLRSGQILLNKYCKRVPLFC